ncbi:unnamed protein product [Coffea canephora]|uniref:Protein FLX-like 4 n=1 Tax=Coffea canephora TaxID=49390 RepID=A0A068U3Y5_COFCA|nr:unnamed protein product [Coffea canephora]
MTSRKHIPSAHEGRSVPGPAFIHHGALPAGHRPMEPLPPPELLDSRLAVQAAEIEQLAVDNHRLAASHGALRQDLVAAQQEIQKLADHIRSMQTESDIQIRVLLERIAKMEVDIRAGESVKKDLQQAHSEARSLALARKELTAQVQKASQELEKARADVKTLPEMNTELDSLRKEHQRLRMTFEYEKGLNIEKVEKMRIMEKEMVGMHGELERLRAEVFNVEKRAHAPYTYGGPNINPHTFYPPAVHGSGGYVDNYGRPAVPMGAGPISPGMIPYGGSVTAGAPDGVGAVAGAVAGAAGNPSWTGTYDALHARR